MENIVKAYLGNLEIIGNGAAHVNAEDSLLLVIDNNLEMEFQFLTDKEDKNSKTQSSVENNRWIWKLTNYVNSLGQGVISPIEIGTLKKRKLYASFFVWTPDAKENRRIINYVIYLDKED